MDLSGLEMRWRGPVSTAELAALTKSHGGRSEAGWWDQVRPHSLGWVTARLSDRALIGFVNVAWDGGDHAFLVDTKTRLDYQRRGVGSAVVKIAAQGAKNAGCEWLHVDFAADLRSFYFGSCDFTPTPAGLIHLYSLVPPQ